MSQAHTQRAHARLAPSAAHRWIACPGSVRLEADLPEQSSVYANEGTAAHTVAARCLQYDDDAAVWLDGVVDIETGFCFDAVAKDNPLSKVNGSTVFAVTEEMVDAVQTYLDAVRSLFGKAKNKDNPDIIVDVEQRLDMTHIHPEIFGTGDAVVYQKTTGHLHVLDFKYGKGVIVDPEENPQLMLYGAGAARRHAGMPIRGITLHIVQPRAPGLPVRSWQTDVLALMEFEDDLAVAAQQTDAARESWVEYERYDDRSLWTEAYLVPGEHCRFCKAAPTCPALREFSKSRALAEFAEDKIVLPEPSTLPPEKLAEVLRDADLIGNWVKAVQEYAHAEAVAGRTPPGFKLVPKRAMRKWTDEERVRAICELADVDPFVEPKLKSPAQLEKTVGKKNFTSFADLVTQQSSGTNLVPVSDARPAVKTEGLLDFQEV